MAAPRLVLAVVTAPAGLMLLHRPGETPPVLLPGARPDAHEDLRAAAERGVLEEARLRVRAGRVLGRFSPVGDRKPVVYVAATPVETVTEDVVLRSLSVGWYSLEQVDMLFPDLWGPVRKHLDGAIRRR